MGARTGFKIRNFGALLTAALCASFFLFSSFQVVHSQNPPPVRILYGKTQKVRLIPWGTVFAGPFQFWYDDDHDGLPNDFEIANGLNPNNPADADFDPDNDGLTNGDEYTLGTNLHNRDTDGDGFSDGQEVNQGYDPLNPNSHPPQSGGQIVSLLVSPSRLNLSVNPLVLAQPTQLTVTGVRSDGSQVDLTRTLGTTYLSLDPTVATVNATGLVNPVAEGATAIQVRNGALTVTASVVVQTFTPGPVGSLPIPGFANNVEVSGNFAFVAAGAAGLQVVNITNPAVPVLAGSLALAGNANDIRIVGTLAYVAAGSSGLHIVDIAVPQTPHLVGGVAFAGAVDVAVKGNLAYVAAGTNGLKLVDVSNPATPVLAGTFPVAADELVNGVAVDPSRALVVLAVSSTANSGKVQIVDVTTPALPTLRSSVAPPATTLYPRDVWMAGTTAYLVSGTSSLSQGVFAVDVSNPAAALVSGSGNLNFLATDIEALNSLCFATSLTFNQGFAAAFSLANPSQPGYVGTVLLNPNYEYGTGLALTPTLVLATSHHDLSIAFSNQKGVNGDTVLSISRYRQGADTAGVAPTVTVTAPTAGDTVVSGDRIFLRATATDDFGVASVEFKANGAVVGTVVTPPYEKAVTLSTIGQVQIEATAYDTAGNTGTSIPVTVQVVPDPLSTVIGQVVNAGGTPVADATVTLTGTTRTTTTDTQGNFSFAGVGTVPTGMQVSVLVSNASGDRLGASGLFTVIRGGTTDLGVIQLTPPEAQILAPADGTILVVGEPPITVKAAATDDSGVARVEFRANGVLFATRTTPPYVATFAVPGTPGTVQLDVRAVDNAGNIGNAGRVQTQVVATDPLTMVVGKVTDVVGNAITGANVTLEQLSQTTTTDSQGNYSFAGVATLPLGFRVSVLVDDPVSGRHGRSASVVTVRGGTTDLGTLALAVSRTTPLPAIFSALGVGQFSGSFPQDLFIGFSDRPSVVYQSVGNGLFTPSATFTLPFGAVRSGTNANLNQDGTIDLVAQPVGQTTEAIAVFSNGNGSVQSSTAVTTGLDQESEQTAAGEDFPSQITHRPVVAFLRVSGSTALTVRIGDGSGGLLPPLSLPVSASDSLRAVQVVDVTGDGLADVLAIRPVSTTAGMLVVYPRTTATAFGTAVETAISLRSLPATFGTVDYAVSDFDQDGTQDVAVLGNDRVLLHHGTGTGAFLAAGEILLPEETVGLGIAALQDTGGQMLAVVVKETTAPLSRSLLLYGNGPSLLRTYRFTATVDTNDVRVVFGDFDEDNTSADVAVVDEQSITTFLDVGPPRPQNKLTGQKFGKSETLPSDWMGSLDWRPSRFLPE